MNFINLLINFDQSERKIIQWSDRGQSVSSAAAVMQQKDGKLTRQLLIHIQADHIN